MLFLAGLNENSRNCLKCQTYRRQKDVYSLKKAVSGQVRKIKALRLKQHSPKSEMIVFMQDVENRELIADCCFSVNRKPDEHL